MLLAPCPAWSPVEKSYSNDLLFITAVRSNGQDKRRNIKVSIDRPASRRPPRPRALPDFSGGAASPPPPFNPQVSVSVTPNAGTASTAIIVDGDDDSDLLPPPPPPPPFHSPEALVSESTLFVQSTASSPPAIVIQDHPPPPDSPPPLPPVPCPPPLPPSSPPSAPPLPSSPPQTILNPQVSASATLHPPPIHLLNPQASAMQDVRTAPPAIFIDVNDPNESVAWYKLVIFEALSILNSPTGSSISDIFNSVEERHGVPMNFRQSLSSKLGELVWIGKLELDQSGYKMKEVRSPTRSEHRAFLAAKAFQEAKKYEGMKSRGRRGRRDG